MTDQPFQAALNHTVAELSLYQAEFHAAMPMLALAQSLEVQTNRKPVLVIPEQSPLAELDKFYGYDVVSAKIVRPMVAYEVPGSQ